MYIDTKCGNSVGSGKQMITVDLVALRYQWSQSVRRTHLNMIAAASLFSCLVCYAALCGATPSPQEDAKSTSFTSSSSQSSSSSSVSSNGQSIHESSDTVSSANGMLIKTTEHKINDDCVSKLTIFGNGIDKTVDYPCGKAPKDIINLKGVLAIGDEWFSDKPKTLVHLTGNQCQKEVFTKQDGKITSTTAPISEEECRKVRALLGELKNKQQEWQEWVAQKHRSEQQRFQEMQQNFDQMFSNIFGG